MPKNPIQPDRNTFNDWGTLDKANYIKTQLEGRFKLLRPDYYNFLFLTKADFCIRFIKDDWGGIKAIDTLPTTKAKDEVFYFRLLWKENIAIFEIPKIKVL